MPARRPLHLLLTGVLSVLLLALIAAARAFLVTPGETTDNLVYSGSANELVDAKRFTMQVHNAEFSRGISDHNLSALATDDVWLLVTATLTATTERLKVEQPVLLENDNGYSYAASNLATYSMGGAAMGETWLEPEVPVTAVVVFEVPPDRVSGPKVRVSVADDRIGGRPLSSEAVADLGMGEEEVRAGIDDAADDVEIPDPEFGDPGGEENGDDTSD